MVKLYWSIWSAFAVIALGVYLSGGFSMMTAVVFGFICFGMIFMGMIGVLPTMVAHPAPAKPLEDKANIVVSPQVAAEGRPSSPVTAGAVRNTHAAVH